MLPDILKQVGPAQYQHLKDAFTSSAGGAEKKDDDDDDDVPELVGTFD